MMNISRILCPIDFSDASQHALEQAALLAGWFEARLTVFHAFQPLFLPVPGLALPGYGADGGSTAEEQQRLRADLERCVAPVKAAGVQVDLAMEPGAPIPHILAKADALQADLIVMGTHGTSGFDHFVLGSVAEKVLRKARCPVLTVPPRAVPTPAVRFKHILCAVDFSESSMTALSTALAIAQETDAQLSLLHVLDWPVHDTPPPAGEPGAGAMVFDLDAYRRMLEGDAAARLARLVPDAAREWCVPHTQVVHGTPHVELLKAATVAQADLIVLGVRGRGPIDLMLFGSTANHVVRRATCPVLTVRAKA